MATHDYVIANGTGAAVRSDLNDALAAIVSNNSSSSEPATTYAYQWWADTNANVLKIRNSANNAWITLRELDGTMLIEDGSASTPGLSFASDTNSGLFGGSDTIGFATGGAERLEIGSSEVVFNDPSNDVDFRVESNGQTHMLFVDAGNDRVGVGTSSPGEALDVNGTVKIGNTKLLSSGSGATFDLKFQTYSGGFFDRVAITGAGKVGIGTTVPNTRLHIQSGDNDFITLGHTSRTGSWRIEHSGVDSEFLAFFQDNGTSAVASYYAGRDEHRFHTAGSERMRIGSNGQTDHYSTSGSVFTSRSVCSAGTGCMVYEGYHSATSTSNGTLSYRVYSNGDVANTNNTYGSLSDITLKENIVPASSQWDNIKDIEVVNYNFKEETGHQTHKQLGVIAQQVEEVSPGLVNTDSEGLKSVNYSVLYMKSVKALQEAMDRIETLETKVAALEAG